MDIGYHFDLTAKVLREAGFNPQGQMLANFGNGVTDLLGNLGLDEEFLFVGPFVAIPIGSFVESQVDALKNSKRLHCDNLFSSDDVANYWKQLLGNLKRVLLDARNNYPASPNKVLLLTKGLNAIGIVFHALQDVCSHSKWCELQNNPLAAPAPALPHTKEDVAYSTPRILNYRKGSIFNAAGVIQQEGLMTGRFGGYYEEKSNTKWVAEWKERTPAILALPLHGHFSESQTQAQTDQYQNLDHQDRRIQKPGQANVTYWDEAYVTAYLSCRHLLAQIQEWIGDSDYRTDLKQVRLNGETSIQFNGLLERVKQLTLYIRLGHEDGHWKGPGSGDRDGFRYAVGRTAGQLYSSWTENIFGILGKTPETVPSLINVCLSLLDDEALPKNLYNDGTMGQSAAEISTITVPAAAVQVRILTLTFTDVAIPPNKQIEHQEGFSIATFYPNDLDGEVAPHLYIEVTIEDPANGDSFKEIFRERTVREIDLNDKLEWVIEGEPREPWQVVCILPATLTEVRCTVRLYDDDRESWFRFGDDEVRLNPVADGKEDALVFTLSELAAGTAEAPLAKLVKDNVSEKFTSSSGGYELIKDNVPTRFSVKGSRDNSWFFDCPAGSIAFSAAVASVES